MKKITLSLSLGLMAVAGLADAQTALKRYGPDTCVQGLVWREAYPKDHVCVTPESREQAERDNIEAVNRIKVTKQTVTRKIGPFVVDRRTYYVSGGDYGVDTCKEGYVWREARPSDHVCVSSAIREQTRTENANAARNTVKS